MIARALAGLLKAVFRGVAGTARPVFRCPDCGAVSPHPDDIAQRYCAACHWWTGDPVLGRVRPTTPGQAGRLREA